jgi:RNA polymerase sigma factor (sigma-70 family)
LVRSAAKGDGRAWSQLVEHYSRYVFSLLRSCRVPEREQADAFQYVFVELHKALPELNNTEKLAPWIRQTTLRHAIRLRERLSRAVLDSETESVLDLQQSPDIVKALEETERDRLVREAVQSLQERCRELVTLLFFTDPPTPYAEAAEKLGLREASIGVIRQRCLEALERALRARGIP